MSAFVRLRVCTCFPEEAELLNKYFGRSQNRQLVVGVVTVCTRAARLWLTRGGLSAAGVHVWVSVATAAALKTLGGGGCRL